LSQFQISNQGFASFTPTENGMISSFPAITGESNDLPPAFRGNYRFFGLLDADSLYHAVVAGNQ
jgi:hypothetical protein